MPRYIAVVSLGLCLFACQHQQDLKYPQNDFSDAPGWASVFQTYTSETETTINILRPHLANITYYVQKDVGSAKNYNQYPRIKLKVIKTTNHPNSLWLVDRVHISKLIPGESYRLLMIKDKTPFLADWRRFKTLSLKESKARFAVGSCMSDSHNYEHVRSLIWDKMDKLNPDFILLLGDQVYVDDFDFVKRDQATSFDLWTRYVESFRKIPLFSNRNLYPILAVWDDHDFGTNNSNKNFKSKVAAKKTFLSFFGGKEIPGVIQTESNGVYFSFKGFGQKFVMMDNRYFRETDATKPFGQWGPMQHHWFQRQLKESDVPVWLANGGQFFSKATYVKQPEGDSKQINESFVDDHPKHFKMLLEDIRKSPYPVLFLSGDVHYSEISRIEKAVFNYETYEITSSPIHSFIYRNANGIDTWLENPRRIKSVKQHNFLLVESEVSHGQVDLQVTSWGVKSETPYFSEKLQVKK